MVATVRCEEIANEKFASFLMNEVPQFHSVSIITLSLSSVAATLHIYI